MKKGTKNGVSSHTAHSRRPPPIQMRIGKCKPGHHTRLADKVQRS